MITKCRCLLYLSCFLLCYLFRPIPISLSAHSFYIATITLTNEERACRENRLYVCAGLHACPQFLNSFIIMRLNSVEMMK